MKKIIILITLALFHISVVLAQGLVMSVSKVLNRDATVLVFNSSESAHITGVLATIVERNGQKQDAVKFVKE